MDFKFCLERGRTKKVAVNKLRAASLFKSGVQAVETAKIIPLDQNTSKTVLRELYEGLREYCEAIGYIQGYKFLNHESISYFLRDVLREQSIYINFDRYRKLRNGINYYGEDINLETVKEAKEKIPELIKQLKKYSI